MRYFHIDNELRLNDELQIIQQVKDELREKRIRVNELEAEVVKSRHDLIGAQKQEEILSERLREVKLIYSCSRFTF